jgi:hypothetical protein
MRHNQSETNEEPDYYEEGGRIVFTRACHLRRGHCCGSGCRHCPFIPRWTRGATRSDRNSATPSASEIPAAVPR